MDGKKKALLVTTVSGFVPQFEMHNVQILQKLGYEVHYASNFRTPAYGTDNHRLDGTGIVRHQMDFERSPFHPANFSVYRKLCSLMRREHFSLVHCHTPMGGVLARLAAHATQTGPVIYTAHGFHFFRGASLKNWLCYYPVEKFLSRYTDEQICINREDYRLAKRKFHAKYINYTPGVGIDLKRISVSDPVLRREKRMELGVGENEIVLLSSGELIPRKNHETAIRAVSELLQKMKQSGKNPKTVHYFICGQGRRQVFLEKEIKKQKISDYVTLLGYRTDMLELYQAADIFLFPSRQEGLPMALLEAMASGLPVVCSDIRGNRDLMGTVLESSEKAKRCRGGVMVRKTDDAAAYAEVLYELIKRRDKLTGYGKMNRQRAEKFSIEAVSAAMLRIYRMISLER